MNAMRKEVYIWEESTPLRFEGKCFGEPFCMIGRVFALASNIQEAETAALKAYPDLYENGWKFAGTTTNFVIE